MKNKKVIVVAAFLIIVFGGGAWKLLNQQKSEQTQQEVTGSQQVVITYTDQGYSPASVNIKKGDTVVWKNESAKDMWPASAFHPTHTAYPGSGIEKCNTAEQPNIFDACASVGPGGSWSFKFLQAGSWKFHDHLLPTNFGTINVE